MVMQFRKGPKVSQEAAVSWAVAARAAHFEKQAGCFVVRMCCVIDVNAVAAADVAAANGKGVEVAVALVDGCAVHTPGAVTGKTDAIVEAVFPVAHLIEHGLATSAKQDSCHSLNVAARTVRAAVGQAAEVAQQNDHSGIPQVVKKKSSIFVVRSDCSYSDAFDVGFEDLRRVVAARVDHLIHIVVTSLLLYLPRLVSGVLVEACSRLASQQASSRRDVVWEAVVVAPRCYH